MIMIRASMIKIIIFFTLILLFPYQALAVNVDLFCERATSRTDLTGIVLDQWGNPIAGSWKKTPFIKQVKVEIRGNSGYFNDPTATGLFNSTRRELRDVVITESSINATYTFSFLDTHRIEINRYTGAMVVTNSIDRKGQYECDVKQVSNKKLF